MSNLVDSLKRLSDLCAESSEALADLALEIKVKTAAVELLEDEDEDAMTKSRVSNDNPRPS